MFHTNFRLSVLVLRHFTPKGQKRLKPIKTARSGQKLSRTSIYIRILRVRYFDDNFYFLFFSFEHLIRYNWKISIISLSLKNIYIYVYFARHTEHEYISHESYRRHSYYFHPVCARIRWKLFLDESCNMSVVTICTYVTLNPKHSLVNKYVRGPEYLLIDAFFRVRGPRSPVRFLFASVFFPLPFIFVFYLSSRY